MSYDQNMYALYLVSKNYGVYFINLINRNETLSTDLEEEIMSVVPYFAVVGVTVLVSV